MADFLEAASAWLTDTFATRVSKSIVYSRGASSVSIDATIGTYQLQAIDGAGMSIEMESTDFLFEASALNFGAGPVLPAEGDRIVYREKTYEVLAVPGGSHYRETDPYGHGLRVHTKLIEE
ncbi:MAG: hypothetical protein E6Q97_24510 [Desulfurellales bacterium]|nr:MAG: hypothetical protein E6Q97_24510 [Desulfurellales bacterium]